MPMQRNKRKREYWCVDRNGAEIEGTRKERKVKCGKLVQDLFLYISIG